MASYTLSEVLADDSGPKRTFTLQEVAATPATPTPERSLSDRLLTSIPGRMLKGASQALDAGAQYLPYALGAVAGGFGAAPNRVSDWLFDQSRQVTEGIKQREQVYEQARKDAGQSGVDVARLVGSALSPANIALGMATGGAAPATMMGRAAYGAGIGGIGGIMTPTTNADNFGGEKLAQTGLGAITGAVATPVIGAGLDAVGKVADRVSAGLMANSSRGIKATDERVMASIRTELARENIPLDSVPNAILDSIKKDVRTALASGRTVDPVALLRQADFRAVGTQGTLGQITRDPAQYTREMNLRGVENSGESLMRRFADQRQAFGGVLTNMGASKAGPVADDGAFLVSDLVRGDKPVKSAVDAAYQAARDSSGRYSQMDVPAFSKMANDALDESQLGAVLPETVRKLLNDVSSEKIPLNVNTYTQLRQVISGVGADSFRQGNQQASLAVDQVVKALDNTPLMAGESDVARTMFASARGMAADRFRTMDLVPALKDAVNGKANPEQFVSKYVIRANPDQVVNLSGALSKDGKDVLRNQIAQHLESKAFGSNVSGDSAFAIERYNSELFKLGRKRLEAFFAPDEVDQLFALGRAAAWAGKRPAGSAVNESNTAAAAMNLFGRLKGASLAVPIVKQFADLGFTRRALDAQVPANPLTTVSPALRNLLLPVPFAAGVSGASGVSQ